MSYLCSVFFMVLDLRLTKGWDSAESLFFVPIGLAFVAEWAFKSGKKSTQYNYVRPLDGA